MRALKEKTAVTVSGRRIWIPCLENQIAFNSMYRDKEMVEDAVYLKELLKPNRKPTALKPGRNNKEERLNFIKYWANYVKTHTDREWSRQQNILINSAIQSARSVKLTPKQYLEIKGEVCRR